MAEQKIVLRQAAEACGMPEGTFYAKAIKFEKKGTKYSHKFVNVYIFNLNKLPFLNSKYKIII